LNVLAYADDVLIGKKWERNETTSCRNRKNIARKLQLQINQGKTKYMIVEWKEKFKTKSKTGQ
jgi:hypothetical protein